MWLMLNFVRYIICIKKNHIKIYCKIFNFRLKISPLNPRLLPTTWIIFSPQWTK